MVFKTSSITDDTIFTAQLTNDQAKAISLPGTASTLLKGPPTKNETAPTKWTELLPTVPAEVKTVLVSGEMAINFTKNVYMLYGQTSSYGGNTHAEIVLLFSQDATTKKWGYLVAVQLQSFTFATLWAPLKAIDNILLVKKASFTLASFDAASAKNVIDAFPTETSGTLPSPQTKLSSIIQLGAGGQEGTKEIAAVQQGFNFYAELDFPAMQKNSGSKFFANILQILPDTQTKADLTLYGVVNTTDQTKTMFTASFGRYLLFNTLEFSGVTLTYYPHKQNQVILVGDMTLTFSKSQNTNNKFAFNGRLEVNDTKASFAIIQKPSTALKAPLFMFGITIKDLWLKVDYTFAAPKPPVNPPVKPPAKSLTNGTPAPTPQPPKVIPPTLETV